MKSHPKGKLILEDGSIYDGYSFGYSSSTAGEVVFCTGMAGYPQSLTDPSYTGQILVFTYPLIGNYGVSDSTVDKHNISIDFESNNIHVKSVIVSEYCAEHNHWNSKKSFETWLKENKIPALFGIDTRALTIKIREKGVMLGKIVIDDEESVGFYDPNKDNLVAEVSRNEVLSLGNGKHKIIVVDCGMKNNILRSFLKKDVTLKIVPWNYDFNQEEYDGLFISNGPGDPTHCKETIENIKKAMELKKPLFGICLGHQLLALASGANTYKLKYGHRGQNQPCVRNQKQGYITSQNHGYAVDKNSLPEGWEELFFNANDGTNEGIKHTTLPFFSVQFHPEGSCGPNDTMYLFDEFIEMIEKSKSLNVETNQETNQEMN
ncbi:glutamine-hydrolyzing carbamoyl-phosphate synthase small subunit [Candidatus Woesearchaeota archaeon]|jgi:carbamoyl-phosphate synthase small subunit|nr:glutamine-hydrolyzing carbamoyl-phosphate synthase small subunit [Candidatus Woesearchaeota archaeon]MBT5272974.1 glutamine-hydrolyzing carbamoyl-phosphate synthase small subunit [Candidatus Woesearchaeota archaeon]MBT6041440.1 glutamine-hydrolyzing carbamoyl-phosphate synthase small subunit [Candidatus Woesearchaeota archaeon]MBT6337323.1 glutamine-hydrolyzing carbamoyl-phosphate synthase small subunit [Candidatus Woesearchaeota archaeon]MBT7927200.1 glutamine-hydrolyzing carbamoyl-phosphat